MKQAEEQQGALRTRVRIVSVWNGKKVYLEELYRILKATIEETELLIQKKDRELFEDILANTISKKIRAKIQASRRWVEKMNALMEVYADLQRTEAELRWKNKKKQKRKNS